MPSRRDQIRMSEEEQVQFIDEQKSLQVATINRDGTPHLSTLWFDVFEGDIVFETFTKSQKIKNLERDPRISCLLEDGLEYEKLRGVQITALPNFTQIRRLFTGMQGALWQETILEFQKKCLTLLLSQCQQNAPPLL